MNRIALYICPLFLCPFILLASAVAEVSVDKLGSEFEKTRQTVPGFHQEFDFTSAVTIRAVNHVSHDQVVIDVSPDKWREVSNGSEDRIRVFDGEHLLFAEPDGTEYVRSKPSEKEDRLPEPYKIGLDWRKAKEIQRLPCGFTGKDHDCVIVELPIKSWIHKSNMGQMSSMTQGVARVMIDTETGLWLECRTLESVETFRTNYRIEKTYSLKRLTYGAPDPSMFDLTRSGMREVRQLTPWNEARIKKQLLGKPAPDLQVTDLQGNPVSLAQMKGKTVLLDFWTTWCPPCQADAPALDRLYERYGNKDFAIIGISVDEPRETVDKFLKKHPHSFPVVLSSENQMPRPYQIGTFPTYLIVGADGTLVSVQQGDKGFASLRKSLGKFGLETE